MVLESSDDDSSDDDDLILFPAVLSFKVNKTCLFSLFAAILFRHVL